ncbi:MAG: hypothetical protein Kow0062_21480 [Acidobacteriota bacterium]
MLRKFSWKPLPWILLGAGLALLAGAVIAPVADAGEQPRQQTIEAREIILYTPSGEKGVRIFADDKLVGIQLYGPSKHLANAANTYFVLRRDTGGAGIMLYDPYGNGRVGLGTSPDGPPTGGCWFLDCVPDPTP